MTDEILYRIAVDKNGEKLGKIIRIEQLLGKTIKKDVPYAIVHVVRSFRLDVKIPLEISKITKTEEQKVWFDILKKDFNDEVIKERARIRHIKATRKSTVKEFFGYGGTNR